MKYIKESLFVVFLLLILGGVFLHFGRYFNYMPYDTTLDDWVKTASYFNNVITPFLVLMSIILLYLTWRTTRAELKSTNDSLELDKVIKVITVMLDTTNGQLNKEVPTSQLSQAFDKIVKEWQFGSYSHIPIFEKNEDEFIQNRKLILFLELPKYSHFDLLTNFGDINVANSLKTDPYEEDTFLNDAVKHHMINAYLLNLPSEELPSIINRYVTILEFINKYKDDSLIKNILIDLFIFSIDEIVIKALNRCPAIKSHSIFVEAIKTRL
ncbi:MULTISPECIES: hypothetical protein [Pseudoalteromonas]|uniref:hypothetical protein n=1 Tax=Pseudoalteromonas TaxID=53246 RepID=UPI0002F9E30E|nr:MULTISPECIES: hypothetical protein [Pseudoalteromonas]MCF6142934.1 hypothetical protein [Pseudoalteromonas mariniglutinosa NCIMB 1770]